MHRQLENIKDSYIGGFRGWGGVIYTLTHLGTLWNQPALLTKAEEIVELLPPLIEQDTQFDIISGAAGCIGSLISMYHCIPSRQTLTAAI
jgi:lantibiotic modifying enzyme